MVLVEFLGQMFQVVNGPGTTPQGTLALRKAPDWAAPDDAEDLVSSMTRPQLEAITKMGSWAANNLDNVTGVTTYRGKRVPQAAAKMARDFPQQGRGAFGGMSREDLKQKRRQERINVSDIRAAMGGAGGGGGGGNGPQMPRGG